MNDDVPNAPQDMSTPASETSTSNNGARRIPVTDLDAPTVEASQPEASQPEPPEDETMTSDITNDLDTAHNSDNSDVTSEVQPSTSDTSNATNATSATRAASSENTEQTASTHDDHDAFAAFGQASSAETEIDILRAELDRAHAELATLKANPEGLETLQAENKTLKDKFLRARADLENYRRRAAQDVERARNSGADGIVLAVLPVYDDLGRALEAAAADPSTLIPGIEAVRDGLKRNLAAQGIQATGNIGEKFDPTYHEALTSMPAPEDELKGTIAQVFQAGFMKDERLIRPAQVVVYQED